MFECNLPISIDQLYASSRVWISGNHIRCKYVGQLIIAVLCLQSECQWVTNSNGCGRSILVQNHQSNLGTERILGGQILNWYWASGSVDIIETSLKQCIRYNYPSKSFLIFPNGEMVPVSCMCRLVGPLHSHWGA